MRTLVWVFLLLGLVSPVMAARLEGRVVAGEAPLPGVVVTAHPDLDPASAPLARSAATGPDGLFRLDLPVGDYALYGWSADRSRFAQCGRNPVSLRDDREPVWAGLQAVTVTPAQTRPYDDDYTAAIAGRVVQDGKPVAGAHVYLYLDVSEDLKGQGYRMSLPTDADGGFVFDGLPESNYYLVARKRQGGQKVGPVREGDLFGFYPANPLTARAGQVVEVALPVVAKLQDAADSETFGRATGPVLSGRVVDAAGQGVAGVHVFAYTDRVIGHQRPAAISTPTGTDGRFTVNLPEAGTYYVGARQRYGDSPAPGELFGMYEETADHGLQIETGQVLEDLQIVVEPISLF